jgi:hypothetical protein|tara:strand:- start:293 stop:694 length:402 start_codon:yes stop_codon:yes gene_type:complete
MSKETEQQNHMPRSQKRKMYKQYGVLDKKNKNTEEGRELLSRLKQEGKDAHDVYTKRVNDSISDQIQSKLNSVIETWKDLGYNDSEIKLLEEAWVISTVKDKETYRSDKKEAKRLRKEANELHTKRLNANNNS